MTRLSLVATLAVELTKIVCACAVPQITRKAAALPGRQIEDFVEGGRARREEWRQQQQTQKEMREAAELTFKPQIITKDAYPHVSTGVGQVAVTWPFINSWLVARSCCQGASRFTMEEFMFGMAFASTAS